MTCAISGRLLRRSVENVRSSRTTRGPHPPALLPRSAGEGVSVVPRYTDLPLLPRFAGEGGSGDEASRGKRRANISIRPPRTSPHPPRTAPAGSSGSPPARRASTPRRCGRTQPDPQAIDPTARAELEPDALCRRRRIEAVVEPRAARVEEEVRSERDLLLQQVEVDEHPPELDVPVHLDLPRVAPDRHAADARPPPTASDWPNGPDMKSR